MNFKLRVKGDMPGDVIVVEKEHLLRAHSLFSKLEKSLREKPQKRFIFAISGPSGSGKSETASVFATLCENAGFPAYVLSMDNYAIRPPRDNEGYREELFHQGNIAALEDYLGTEQEVLFSRVEEICQQFKNNANTIKLRFMSNQENRLSSENTPVNFLNRKVLVLEGSWSGLIRETDYRIFIKTDFEKTIAHRKKRARDPLNEFGEMVLAIEQEKLELLQSEMDFILDDEKIARAEINHPELHHKFLSSGRPRVLMITNHGLHEWDIVAGLPDTGGQNVYVNQLTDCLCEMGFQVTIANRGGFCFVGNDQKRHGLHYRDENSRIFFMTDSKPLFIRKEDMLGQIPELAESLHLLFEQENKPELIISHYWDGAAVGKFFRQKNPEIPHLWIPHSLGTLKKKNMPPESWEKLRVDERIDIEKSLIAHIDDFGSTSSAICNDLQQEYGAGNIYDLPPCINEKRFFPKKIADDHEIWNILAGATRAFNKNPLSAKEIKNCRIISEISRTDRTKRKDILIKAFAEICESYNAFLIITINPEQADLHTELLDLIKKHNIGQRIAVMGNVSELVPVIYNISHVYCTPSVMEGFGMSIQEAAACSVPAVSSQLVPFAVEYLLGEKTEALTIPENPKKIKKGAGAIVVPADSIPGFSYALEMLLSDEKLRQEMGQRAFEITIPHFTWKNMTAKFLNNALNKHSISPDIKKLLHS